ncbi:ring finger protein 32 [Stylonychia lemnae]|uniref:Ring finger protein 32 n=1 Tax=Stylonychia lemnae TaxID=5949 RepID=A0A078AWF9_STYLE|nr:ring finger protein 32 [Stylonychia lemnae]|eukprot:CDW86376.1 ring finger protein 32 [Stylonychia lemnae]
MIDPFQKKTTAQNKLPPRQSNLSNNGLQIMSGGSSVGGTSAGGSVINMNSFSRQNSSNQQPRENSQSRQSKPQMGVEKDQITKMFEEQNQNNENAFLDIENKRIQYIKKLSLAQRLGLVEKPPLPLSQVEWKNIEKVSLQRFNEKEPCPICYEELSYQDQNILSCSHVFHKKCLESFEKFMKIKGHEKACPICRKKDYDKKTYVEGQKRYLTKCIVRIQCHGRGFLARNTFFDNLKARAYQPITQTLRKKFIGYKLSRIGKKQRDQMDKERLAVIEMVQKVDKSIKDTEQLLESFIPNMARYFQQKREKELQSRGGRKLEEQKLNKFWQQALAKATSRGDKDCPICYNPYKTASEVYLLNCTHMYHKCCLESFENFDIAQNSCCPMCRQPNYEKISVKS